MPLNERIKQPSFWFMVLGSLMVAVPEILTLCNVDPGKVGHIVQIIGAVKAAVGALQQTPIGPTVAVILFCLTNSALAAETTTATVSHTSTHTKSLAEDIGIAAADIGFGPHASFSIGSCNIDLSDCGVLNVGAGVGVGYKFDKVKYPCEAFLDFAPVCSTAHGCSFGVVSGVSLLKSFGLGLGYAFASRDGWHAPDGSHLFILINYSPSNSQ